MTRAAQRGPFDGRLLARTGSARPALAAAVAVGVVATLAVAAQAVLLARLVASAFPGAHVGASRTALVLGFAAATGVRAAAALARELVGRRGAARVKSELRAALVARSLVTSGSAVGAGERATLAGRGLDALDAYVGRCLPDLVLAGVSPAILLVVLGVTDWLSAVIVLVALALFPVFGMLVGWATRDRARARWAEIAALGDHLVDLFEGLPVLRSYGRTARERDRLEEMGERLRCASRATLRLAFLSALVLDTLASIATALVAVPIGLRLVSGSMSLAAGLAVLVVTPEVFLPLRRASAEFHESAEGLAAAAQVLDLLDAPPEPAAPAPVPAASRLPPDPAQVTLALQGVTVLRPGRSRPVLDGVDLAVEPGETVALVGANGAGKSTICALLLGLLAPSAGRVLAGGRDLAALDLPAWRERCSYLPDRPTLLPATVAENLRVAAPGVGAGTLERALEDAACTSVVAGLPFGMATLVGEGGHALSGGERQRLALARALVRDAGCYVLDEPTAHLDAATEEAVVRRLRARLAGRSALLVTHRPAVLALADRVLAVRGGAVVECAAADALELVPA